MKFFMIGTKPYRKLIGRIEKLEEAVYKSRQISLDKQWLDGDEVCSFLNISKRTLQRLRSDQVISYSTLNKKLYYPLSEIQSLLNENMVDRKSKVR